MKIYGYFRCPKFAVLSHMEELLFLLYAVPPSEFRVPLLMYFGKDNNVLIGFTAPLSPDRRLPYGLASVWLAP